MLVEDLNVSLSDLMPITGVAVSLPGETMPYRISERLHAALKDEAARRGVILSVLLGTLRDELHAPPMEILQ
jgi:hypothetical protein